MSAGKWATLWLAVTIIFLATLFLLLSSLSLRAEPGHTHDGPVGEFYRTWMRPDNPALSCCNEQDCAPAQSRIVNGRWQGRTSDDEEWLTVPLSRIETMRDSPDGRSHICKRGTSVYCFLPASGG